MLLTLALGKAKPVNNLTITRSFEEFMQSNEVR
jgi:hypothetical protein